MEGTSTLKDSIRSISLRLSISARSSVMLIRGQSGRCLAAHLQSGSLDWRLSLWQSSKADGLELDLRKLSPRAEFNVATETFDDIEILPRTVTL
ncbi:unnamed protein product [Mycena citricolor]|uniref:Uncharacterized protein n=1 Tax=Mycena citricolor TaxID=2018698 RepID=A0AAD2Q2V2_9AGAR|nr:unnamed protein product [Mycena citricolor]